MGFVTAGVAYTTGEITAFMPSTGGFVRHATKFVEPALGAATGWNFCKLHNTYGGPFQRSDWSRVYDGHQHARRDQRRSDARPVLEHIHQPWCLDHHLSSLYHRRQPLLSETLRRV